MRILLFDWTVGGHHGVYLQRFAEALGEWADVVVAAADELATELDDVDVVALGPGRPSTGDRRSDRVLAQREVTLLERAAREIRPDHLIHLYADPVLMELVRRPTTTVPVSLCVFYPRAHYLSAYRTLLPPRDQLHALQLERLVDRWRRRLDSHAVLALDHEAVRRWASRRRAASAHWLPEPPTLPTPNPRRQERSGCVLYGVLAPRKGIDSVARAIGLGGEGLRVVLAGTVEPGFLPDLRHHVREMERGGATVELRARPHGELEGLDLLAGARCALLPYHRHGGMSRVLLEACAVGTPVVVHDHGMLGHLVREHRLGRVVDCGKPAELRQAILALAGSRAVNSDRTADLARFAARHSRERFRAVLSSVFAAEAFDAHHLPQAKVGSR